MPRNIIDAQKVVWNFHKSDALAQTNQIKYDCFFMHGMTLDFILFFNIKFELSKEIFLSPEYSDFGSKF